MSGLLEQHSLGKLTETGAVAGRWVPVTHCILAENLVKPYVRVRERDPDPWVIGLLRSVIGDRVQ